MTAKQSAGLSAFVRTVRRMAPMLRAERWLIIGGVGALLASTAMQLLEPWPLKVVIDRLTGTGDALPALDRLTPSALLLVAAAAVLAATGLRALFSFAHAVAFALVGNRVTGQLRTTVHAHLHRLSLSFHNRSRSGELVTRVMGDTGQLRDVAVTALVPLVVDVVTLAGMIGVMVWMDWRLALLVCGTLPVFGAVATLMSRRIHQNARRQRQREGAMSAVVAEGMSSMRAIQALALEPVFLRVFGRASDKGLTEGARGKRLEASLERTVDVLVGLATAVALWFGGRFVLRATLSPGELIVFLAYLRSGFKPVRDIAKYTGRLAKGAAAGDRVLALLETEPDVRDRPGAHAAPRLRGHAAFEHVSFAYEGNQLVLRDVSFELAPGRRVALVGSSGSGKSTAASLLLRLYDPVAGRVLIDGRDARDYTLASLRPQFSVVLQEALLFAGTIRDNIAAGADGATTEALESAARLAGAHAFIAALPAGYDTLVGERGVTLSGGERQRIAIARAALRGGAIVVLDEPTTGLDAVSARLVEDAIDRLTRDRASLVITHELALAARADDIVVLDHGAVVERGTHAALMARAGVYARLFRAQHTAREHFAKTGEGWHVAIV